MGKKIIFLSFFLIFFLSNAPGETIEVPIAALKFIADSRLDPCPICRKKLLSKAFNILNKTFEPGRIITANNECRLEKKKELVSNEFLLSCYLNSEFYKNVPGKGKIYFPAITFKFHTNTDHLIGIAKSDYSEDKYENMYKKSRSNAVFNGEIKLIEYKYGDGTSYNYFEKRNIIQINCKVLMLK